MPLVRYLTHRLVLLSLLVSLGIAGLLARNLWVVHENALASAELAADAKRLREVSREHAQLGPLVETLKAFDSNTRELAAARAMLADPEMKDLAEEEMKGAKERLPQLETDLQKLLLPRDPNDEKSVILEIRAGTGGDEAALFAGDLLGMYRRFAESQGWQFQLLELAESDLGGVREAVARAAKQGVAVRLIVPERDLKLGVLTALIGAPFFLHLIWRSQRDDP